jgi:hypothetical protein
MSRVIHSDSAGKRRNQLSKAIVLAIRELMKQTEPNSLSRDLAAFIALAAQEIAQTVDVSVQAWEKRGYWVKADRFRLDWEWAEALGKAMEQAVRGDDWPQVALTAVKIAQKLSKVKVAEKNRIGAPWIGAWKSLQR